MGKLQGQVLGSWLQRRLDESKEPSSLEVNVSKKMMRNFVCPAKGCGKTFAHYDGVKTVGGVNSGMAYCQDHNPNFQKLIAGDKNGANPSVQSASK